MDCGDHRVAINPADRMIGGTIIREKNWQRADFEFVLSALRNADLSVGPFVDVGANIGTQTIYAMKSGRFASGIAIEPDLANFHLLTTNLALNGLTDRVEALNVAASDRIGRATLNRSLTNHGAHTISVDGTDIALGPLRDILGGRQVGLLWIDVEGHEPEVVRGLPADFSAPMVLEFNGSKYGPRMRPLLAELGARYRGFVRLGADLDIRPTEQLASLARGDILLMR
ncbi:MAG: FkbM family methyltransferase [Bauldia sp.]